LGDTKPRGEDHGPSAESPEPPNFANLLVSQLRPRVPLAVGVPPLFDAIVVVVRERSEEQVLRVAAGRVIAAVTNMQGARLPVSKRIGDSVR
jgi:hypothetical protein